VSLLSALFNKLPLLIQLQTLGSNRHNNWSAHVGIPSEIFLTN